MTDKTSVGVDRSQSAELKDPRSQFLLNAFPRGIHKVLLVNPPDADCTLFRYATAKRGRYTNYPPYGLAVLATHLRGIGVEVEILNLNHVILKACDGSKSEDDFDFDGTWQSALEDSIDSVAPDLIGLTCMFTMTHKSLKQVCEFASRSAVPIAIGGVHVNNDTERVLDDITCVDIAFLNEGDVALQRFVRAANSDIGVDSLAQVILNDRNGRIRITESAVPDAETISMVPALDQLDIKDYARYGRIGAFYFLKEQETRFATVLSNRGCRAQCTFCSVRDFNGAGVRQRSVSSVVDELEILEQDYGVGHVMWLDDDLLKDSKRSIELFNEMVRRNLTLTWDATNGLIAAACTEEVIDAAVQSGCIAVNIGMESGNPEILRQIRKPGTVKSFISAADVLRKHEGLHVSLLLMIGFPNETMSMINDTILVAKEMDPDWCRISPLQPLPNTPIYDAMVAQGLIQDVGSQDVRFAGGAFGKQVEVEQGLRMAESERFEEAFSGMAMDQVPGPEQITDIWFFMNYHLNFHRLFDERRPVKVEQQMRNLRSLSETISPENGFALYFLGYLEYMKEGTITSKIVERLKRRLATSDFWEDRFDAFGLRVSDLETLDFKSSHASSFQGIVNR